MSSKPDKVDAGWAVNRSSRVSIIHEVSVGWLLLFQLQRDSKQFRTLMPASGTFSTVVVAFACSFSA